MNALEHTFVKGHKSKFLAYALRILDNMREYGGLDKLISVTQYEKYVTSAGGASEIRSIMSALFRGSSGPEL